MKRDHLWQALDGLDDRHIAAAVRFDPDAALRERSTDMKNSNTSVRRRTKRLVTVALAAALLLALGATAYAAGWFDSIFGQAAQIFNTNDETETRIEAAAAAVSEAPPEPETVELPDFDGSALTLKESYYDGEGLLLGIDLDGVTPDPVVGYEPDEALLERITQPNLTYQFYYSTQEDLEQMRQNIEENYQGTADYDDLMAQVEAQEALLAAGDPDDLDLCLETGYTSQEMYDESMAARTERGAAAGLHYESAIWLDRYMQEDLTGEQYEQFWETLERDGAVCVAMRDVYIADHILLADGTDLGVGNQYETEAGTFIEVRSLSEDGVTSTLPDEARGLDELTVQLKVRSAPVYYYMQLDGRAYALHDEGSEQLVPFTIVNSAD